MAKGWKHTLELGDVFHNDALTLEQKTEQIVRRVKASRWFQQVDDDGYGELTLLLDELEDAAKERHVEWWDDVWNSFYTITDSARVWVSTHAKPELTSA